MIGHNGPGEVNLLRLLQAYEVVLRRHDVAPAEDTYLLIDAIIKDMIFLKILKPKICVEVGCGTGSVSVVLSQALKKARIPDPMFFLTDINPEAAAVARSTCVHNNVAYFDVVRTDLLASLSSRLENSIDVLIFNPPYVPTPPEEVGSTGISAAWAGGIHGREVIDKLLPQLGRVLSPRGVFYMLVVIENLPEDIEEVLKGFGFSTKTAPTLIEHALSVIPHPLETRNHFFSIM